LLVALILAVAVAVVAIYFAYSLYPRPPAGGEGGEKPPEEKPPATAVTLTVISRHPTDILLKARELFLKSDVAKAYNITDLKTVVLPPGLWESYITSGQADVAWGGGPTLFDYLYTKGLLAPLNTSLALNAASQIPDEVSGMPMKRFGPDGKIYWVAAAISSFGFTVNHDRLKDYGLKVPLSWRDLASPEMGKPLVMYGEAALGIADPTQSTSNTRMFEIILQHYGWEEGWRILTLMAANSVVYSGSGDVRDAVISGDIAVGITIDYYGYTAKYQNPACEYVLPQGESIVNGDPIALVKGTRYPEAAQAFIAWVLTDGQVILLDPNINRMPANPRVFDTPEGRGRPDLREAFEITLQTRGMAFNDTLALLYEQVMQWYFRATLVEPHDYLKSVWTTLLKKYVNGEIGEREFNTYVNALVSPIKFIDPDTGMTTEFTEEYAISINRKFAEDAVFRDKLLNSWKNAAIKKYTGILDSLSH